VASLAEQLEDPIARTPADEPAGDRDGIRDVGDRLLPKLSVLALGLRAREA
jgi:hypothetical protein